jgi:hypothetical protein|tara:strand:+ start:1363 stop:1533 length:171 start_codon:yes stop_codon:yes gene_type:complete
MTRIILNPTRKDKRKVKKIALSGTFGIKKRAVVVIIDIIKARIIARPFELIVIMLT